MPLVSRQGLYERVWADPVRAVAQEFGLSDAGLKKICQRADIPVPDRGYWAKLRAGKAVKPIGLPMREPGMPDAVYVGEHSRFGWYHSDPEAELAEPPPAEPHFDEPLEELQKRIAARVGKVIYERTLKGPHGLIRNLLDEDEKRRLKTKGVSWRVPSMEPLFDSDFEKRRLRILSSLFTALQRFGCQPWITDAEARIVGVVVGAEHVSFFLDHPSAKPDRNGQWKTRPGWADELRLTIEGKGARSWSDTEEHGLEAHLTDIVVALIAAGELSYRASARSEFEHTVKRRSELKVELVRRRAEADRKANEALIEADKAMRAELLKMASDLRAADDIRALVARVLEKNGPDNEAASGWGAWALLVAEQLDPSGLPINDPAELALKAET